MRALPRLLACALAATLVGGAAVACRSDQGKIRVDGSSTVFPISEAAAEEFSKVSRTRVNVAFSGTGGGFERFCRGETEINDASRPVKQKELDNCAAHGITDVIPVQVAIDALTVVVNADNDWVDCLTVDELHHAFKGGGPRTWAEIRPGWPDEPIVFYFPGTDSGTFDYFNETIITGVDKTATHRGDGTASEDDNVLALGIENDRNAIGYFGFAYFQEAGARIKGVPIDGGDGCVAPSVADAVSGTYQPLSRPLFLYTRTSFLKERPEVGDFMGFYLDHSEALVSEVGYIALPPALLQEQKEKLAAAAGR